MTSSAPAPSGARTVALFLISKESSYQQALLLEGRDAARRLRIRLEASFGDGQFELQIKQIYAALARPPEAENGVHGLVIMPIKEGGYGRIGANAARGSVPCVFLNREVDLDGPRRDFPRAALSVVTPDQRRCGLEQGLQYRTWFEEAGRLRPGCGRRVLYVQGPPDTSSARDRLEGMRQAVEGWPADLTVANGDWTEEGGREAVARLARTLGDRGAFDAIVSQNDEMARGATRALGMAAGTLPTFGIDGLPGFGQGMVDSGELAATVVMPTTCGPALELLAQAFRGEPAAPKVVLPSRWHPERAALQDRARRWAAA